MRRREVGRRRTGRGGQALVGAGPGAATIVYIIAYLALAAGGGRRRRCAPAVLPVVITVVGLACTILSLFLVLSLCRVSLKRWTQAVLLVLLTGARA